MPENTERKNLGIDGSINIPNSDYWLCPGSVWAKQKTIINGYPQVDETELEETGELDEDGEKKTII